MNVVVTLDNRKRWFFSGPSFAANLFLTDRVSSLPLRMKDFTLA